jgi:hypothetical protein
MAELTTTLRLLREHGACGDRYEHLVKCLGAGWDDDTPIPLTTILDHNGMDGALWALRAVEASQAAACARLARLYACWCVRHTPIGDGLTVWDLLTDERSRHAVEVSERYARGEATMAELYDAWDDAFAAASDASAGRAAEVAAALAADAAAARAADALAYARSAQAADALAYARSAQAAELRRMLDGEDESDESSRD